MSVDAMMTASATAIAHPNIALVKYWGKRDEALMLPDTGSLSMTLDAFPTETTVTLDAAAERDGLILNGAPASEEATRRVVRLLDIVRAWAADAGLPSATSRVRVDTRNEAPTGAGLASSASGFGALAVAAAAAFGLDLDDRALSRLARRGSGSAARSIAPRFAIWHEGVSDETSFAEPIDAPDMRMVIVVSDEVHKAVSSREGMRRTAATSPFHEAWIATTRAALDDMVEACHDRDFSRIGRIAETNALRMHAHIQSAEPAIRYLAPSSIAVFDEIERMRADGLEAWGTADAGPNVIAITRPEDADRVADRLRALGVGAVHVMGPGPGARLVRGPRVSA